LFPERAAKSKARDKLGVSILHRVPTSLEVGFTGHCIPASRSNQSRLILPRIETLPPRQIRLSRTDEAYLVATRHPTLPVSSPQPDCSKNVPLLTSQSFSGFPS